MNNMMMTPPAMNSSSSNSPMTMTMQMSFYWGKDVIILFSGWPKESLAMYILAFFFVFILAFAIEFLSQPPSAISGKSHVIAGALQATVYAVRIGFTYMVMLAVMSFNVGIFIAAVAGHSLGFFVVKTRDLALMKKSDSQV